MKEKVRDYDILSIFKTDSISEYLDGNPSYENTFIEMVNYPIYNMIADAEVQSGTRYDLAGGIKVNTREELEQLPPSNMSIEALAHQSVKERKSVFMCGQLFPWTQCLLILNLLDNISEQQKKIILEDHSAKIFYITHAFYAKYGFIHGDPLTRADVYRYIKEWGIDCFLFYIRIPDEIKTRLKHTFGEMDGCTIFTIYPYIEMYLNESYNYANLDDLMDKIETYLSAEEQVPLTCCQCDNPFNVHHKGHYYCYLHCPPDDELVNQDPMDQLSINDVLYLQALGEIALRTGKLDGKKVIDQYHRLCDELGCLRRGIDSRFRSQRRLESLGLLRITPTHQLCLPPEEIIALSHQLRARFEK